MPTARRKRRPPCSSPCSLAALALVVGAGLLLAVAYYL
uniref:Uncharacterized protein n=1 Tax=Arundo donax TaxID=35708 RepID=A0A0A8YNX2_ARUDO